MFYCGHCSRRFQPTLTPPPPARNVSRSTHLVSDVRASILLVFGTAIIPYLIRMVRLVVAYNQAYRFKYARFVKWNFLARIWAFLNVGLVTRGALFYGSKPEHRSRYASSRVARTTDDSSHTPKSYRPSFGLKYTKILPRMCGSGWLG